MFRVGLCDAGRALCASLPRETVVLGRLAPGVSNSRLWQAPERRQSSLKSNNAASSSSADETSDDDDTAATAPSSPPPPPPPQNPFYAFMTSTPASRAAAASGASLTPAPRPVRVCRRCDGCGDVECPSCSGQGSLPRGGYSRRNALNASKAVGTTWTALQRTLGRTHFDCRGKRVIGGVEAGGAAIGGAAGGESGEGDESEGQESDGSETTKKKKKKKKKRTKGGQTYFLMVATCDDEIRLWVPQQTLKDRGAWAAGWLAREDLVALRREVNGGEGGESGESGEESKDASRGASCKKCEGTGRLPCPLCSRAGEMIHV